MTFGFLMETLAISPINWIIAILTLVNLGLVVRSGIRLASEGDRDRLVALESGVNAILFISLLIVFLAFLVTFRGFMPSYPESIAASGTGDPRVIFGGILTVMIPLNMSLTAASFFLVAWFILRAVLRKKLV